MYFHPTSPTKHSFSAVLSLLTIIILFQNCVGTRVQREVMAVEDAQQLNREAEYLKLHISDGTLYVLHSWQIEADRELISGMGSFYNMNRKLITESTTEDSKFFVPFSDVALIETNHVKKSSTASIAAMTLVSVPMTITSIICLTDPKACFGSCPTFYVHDGDSFRLQAEGFSSSIARSLEESDVDKLYISGKAKDDFTIKLTNEALETHAIRHADLLIFPSEKGKDVFATQDGRFYYTGMEINPARCEGPEGDIKESVSQLDQEERFSFADSTNLAEKEDLYISFEGIEEGQYGLLLASRQTLLTTFLFYQSLAYMGNYGSFYGTKLEKGSQFLVDYANKMYNILGGIEVSAQRNDMTWQYIDELKEMGPIASDVHLIELPYCDGENIDVRLNLTKGLWRLDYVALVPMGTEAKPLRLQPESVHTAEGPDMEALKNLINPENFLATYPRESYFLNYNLPGGQEYITFLESKGYYYEWKRENWISEENQKLFRMMFMRPKHYLKVMAPEFKKREPYMEEIFWNSRYAL
jgi:hypothetical protein